MNPRWIAAAAFVLAVLAGLTHGQSPPESDKKVRVTIDVSETPELEEWAAKSKTLVEEWHPKVSEMLKTDGFAPPGEIKLVFKKDMKGVAYASGKTINIAADWVTKHPDDWGMVVHEMTHVVQSYRAPGKDTGWLVEGIADYIRFYKFEPKATIGRIDPKRASYKDGYRTTAQLLAWIERTHDKEIVKKLNQALREGDYHPAIFRGATGKSVEVLWADFVKTLGR